MVDLAAALERVNNNKQSGNHTTAYDTKYTLEQEGKKSTLIIASCFGQLSSNIYAAGLDVDKTTLTYLPFDKIILSNEVAIRWLELCQDIGVISRDRPASLIFEEGLRVDLGDKLLSPFDFYASVSFYRWLRECPRLVENTLDLVFNGGAEFWASLIYSHILNCTAAGHSIMDTTVYSGKSFISVWALFSLKRHFSKEGSVDIRSLNGLIKANSSCAQVPWLVHSNVLKLGNKIPILKDKGLSLKVNYLQILQSSSAEEYIERLSNYTEENDIQK